MSGRISLILYRVICLFANRAQQSQHLQHTQEICARFLSLHNDDEHYNLNIRIKSLYRYYCAQWIDNSNNTKWITKQNGRRRFVFVSFLYSTISTFWLLLFLHHSNYIWIAAMLWFINHTEKCSLRPVKRLYRIQKRTKEIMEPTKSPHANQIESQWRGKKKTVQLGSPKK